MHTSTLQCQFRNNPAPIYLYMCHWLIPTLPCQERNCMTFQKVSEDDTPTGALSYLDHRGTRMRVDIMHTLCCNCTPECTPCASGYRMYTTPKCTVSALNSIVSGLHQTQMILPCNQEWTLVEWITLIIALYLSCMTKYSSSISIRANMLLLSRGLLQAADIIPC